MTKPLQDYPAASSAQVHDWLKGQHKDFPYISSKTVYNFLMAVRQKYPIALREASREYFVVDELPHGLQAQADFGNYPDRFELFYVKDMDKTPEKLFTCPDYGSIDFKNIFAQAKKTKIKHYIVEIEKTANPITCIEDSISYLKKPRF